MVHKASHTIDIADLLVAQNPKLNKRLEKILSKETKID